MPKPKPKTVPKNEAVAFIREFIEAFPEFNDPDAPLSGSDAVDRAFNLWERAQGVLADIGQE